MWNELSHLCAFFSVPTIGSPINFQYKQYRLKEYDNTEMPEKVYKDYIAFCYPKELKNREEEIKCDRENYWRGISTFIVYHGSAIVGCVQVIPRTSRQKLPVEYAFITTPDGSKARFDISKLFSTTNVTEIYRCRRSFELNRMDSAYVILMLFRAVWAKVIQIGSAYACISFDNSKRDLRSLYQNKLMFIDPGVNLSFGDDPTTWRLLVKDWTAHEQLFATMNRTNFMLQTWARMSLKKKRLQISGKNQGTLQNAYQATMDDVLITHNVIAPQTRRNLRESGHNP